MNKIELYNSQVLLISAMPKIENIFTESIPLKYNIARMRYTPGNDFRTKLLLRTAWKMSFAKMKNGN